MHRSRNRGATCAFVPALVALLLVCVAAGPARAARGPFMRISEREIDFGQVQQHDQVHHDLFIRNDGDAPLRILKIEADCGCTAAIPSDSIVPPGKEIKVDVAFSTRDYKEVIEKRLTIRTDDPAEPKVVITVRADVRPLIRFSEEPVRLAPVRTGEAGTERIRMSADASLGLEVIDLSTGKTYVDAVMQPPVTEGDERVVYLDIKVRPGAPPGTFQEGIDIRTSKPKAGTTKLMVSGQVISYFQVKGSGKLRIMGKAGQPAKGNLQITCDGTKAFQLTGVQTGLDYVTGAVTQKDAKTWDVEITIGPQAPGGILQQKVKVQTTDPAQPVIEIFVQGQMRGA